MKRILHVIPTEGLRVVDPVTRKPLTDRGLVVPAGDEQATYWLRRVADGDVTLLDSRLHEPGAVTPPAGDADAQA